MRFLEMAPFGEFAHRPVARLASIGEGRDHSRRLEKQAFANAVGGHDQLTCLEPGHHFGGNRESGDDEVGAPRSEPRDRGAQLG